jgi:hypothetical protein
MKKTAFILMMIMIMFTFNVTANDYKKKNHKLNKTYLQDLNKQKPTFKIIDSQIKISYLEKNRKLNKDTHNYNLVMKKSKIKTDYKSRNHKLSKY